MKYFNLYIITFIYYIHKLLKQQDIRRLIVEMSRRVEAVIQYMRVTPDTERVNNFAYVLNEIF
jgi:hypothetical protein